MMKNWIMSVLGQQPNRKRTKIEIDLRFEKQSFRPEPQALAEENDSIKTHSGIPDLDSNVSQFKSPNSK
ncbi:MULTISPECIES: hypothetical protein [Shewanella]|uniref:hypothetical protein n=2 Tax=Shewanella TaxID=22 RepID=UPI0006D65358|nr:MULTISPECIES: hypothetical protein [Shewanella]KPZ67990.1 hypothetical protein AN944_03793 [Shewanella sp. P1-14-1]OBT03788.1 hypothetical protein A9267_19540 [Shewanella sp. UCD-FRSSP16_17]